MSVRNPRRQCGEMVISRDFVGQRNGVGALPSALTVGRRQVTYIFKAVLSSHME